jgi:Holliday junction resolvase-like predicted endonuclease
VRGPDAGEEGRRIQAARPRLAVVGRMEGDVDVERRERICKKHGTTVFDDGFSACSCEEPEIAYFAIAAEAREDYPTEETEMSTRKTEEQRAQEILSRVCRDYGYTHELAAEIVKAFSPKGGLSEEVQRLKEQARLREADYWAAQERIDELEARLDILEVVRKKAEAAHKIAQIRPATDDEVIRALVGMGHALIVAQLEEEGRDGA